MRTRSTRHRAATRPLALMLSLAASVTFLQPRPARAADTLEERVDVAWSVARRQAERTIAITPIDRYPMTTLTDGRWHLTTGRAWTSGFWPGVLWALHERTGDPEWKTRARWAQEGVAPYRFEPAMDLVGHDIGFMMMTSFGNAYRLTGRERYRRDLLEAAASLATRYDGTVGAIRSWGPRSQTTQFKVIIDNMMNLELLLWAAEHGGEESLRGIAIQHALTTMREHVRPDGGTWHVVDFDQATGEVRSKQTSQGYRDWSTWARGQAWGLHGFTTVYRETGDDRFLATARRLAGYFVDHLPEDAVPYWDFQAPRIPDEPKDSSAAAIAASGLLELARVDPDPAAAARWGAQARRILAALLSPAYLDEAGETMAVLLHGTAARPANQADTGLIYGDYYLLEALRRLECLVEERHPGFV